MNEKLFFIQNNLSYLNKENNSFFIIKELFLNLNNFSFIEMNFYLNQIYELFDEKSSFKSY